MQQTAESVTDQDTAEQGEISAKFVNGQNSGFDYEGLNRITQTSGQQSNGTVDGSSKVWHNSNQENIQKGEDNNGGNNTELLARRTVSATDRSGNGLWEQSENSRKLTDCLGISQTGDGKHGETIWAGERGWINKDTQPQRETGEGFIQSLFGKIRGIKLNGRDTAGRTISQEITGEFKDTVFKDENGNLLSLYHSFFPSFLTK